MVPWAVAISEACAKKLCASFGDSQAQPMGPWAVPGPWAKILRAQVLAHGPWPVAHGPWPMPHTVSKHLAPAGSSCRKKEESELSLWVPQKAENQTHAPSPKPVDKKKKVPLGSQNETHAPSPQPVDKKREGSSLRIYHVFILGGEDVY